VVGFSVTGLYCILLFQKLHDFSEALNFIACINLSHRVVYCNIIYHIVINTMYCVCYCTKRKQREYDSRTTVMPVDKTMRKPFYRKELVSNTHE